MDMGPRSGVPLHKPEKRSTTKRRKDRAEATQKQTIRAKCVARDGFCRLERAPHGFNLFIGVPRCGFRSEWAHLGAKKRARTRGQAPEIRHTTKESLMFCDEHHRRYDGGDIEIEFLTADGADGLLLFRADELSYAERVLPGCHEIAD